MSMWLLKDKPKDKKIEAIEVVECRECKALISKKTANVVAFGQVLPINIFYVYATQEDFQLNQFNFIPHIKKGFHATFCNKYFYCETHKKPFNFLLEKQPMYEIEETLYFSLVPEQITITPEKFIKVDKDGNEIK